MTDPDMGDINDNAGQESRRRVLKKIGVAGAAAWVAPAVLSSAAHAQGSGTASISDFVSWCTGTPGPNGEVIGGVQMTVTTSGPGLFLIQYVNGVWDGGCYGPLDVGPSGQGFSNIESSQRCFEVRPACPPPSGPILAGQVCSTPCPD